MLNIFKGLANCRKKCKLKYKRQHFIIFVGQFDLMLGFSDSWSTILPESISDLQNQILFLLLKIQTQKYTMAILQ